MIDWKRVMERRDEVGSAAFTDITKFFLLEVSEALAKFKNETPRDSVAERMHF